MTVTERMAALGGRLYELEVFKRAYPEGTTKERLATEAATFVLYGMYEVGEIDNFGAKPTIDELAETIIKLTEQRG